MSCHAQLWLDQIVPSILQVERLNETINILLQINTEYYILLQCWCSYLNFVLSKVRLVHFSFSKNYLHAKGAHNSFLWVANSRGIPGSCNYSVWWLCFILCSPEQTKFFFHIWRFLYLLDFWRSSETIHFYDFFVYKCASTKVFPLILSQGKIANLFWHAI